MPEMVPRKRHDAGVGGRWVGGIWPAWYGIVNHRNYRIRALLYAGKPNWDILPTLEPH